MKVQTLTHSYLNYSYAHYDKAIYFEKSTLQMNYSMEVSIEKFVKDLPRLQQIMDDPFGTIIHVKVWTN